MLRERYSVLTFIHKMPVLFDIASGLVLQQGHTSHSISKLMMFCSGLYYRPVPLRHDRAVASGTYELFERGLNSAVSSNRANFV